MKLDFDQKMEFWLCIFYVRSSIIDLQYLRGQI